MSNYDSPDFYEQPGRTERSDAPDTSYNFPPRAQANDNNRQQGQPNGANPLASQHLPQRDSRGNTPGRRNSRTFGQAVVTLALLLIAFTGGWFSHQAYTSALISPNDQSRYYSNIVQQAWTIIDQNYVDRKAVNYKQMSYEAIRAMLAVLRDKGHTYFLTPEEVKAQQQSLSGNSSGIGVYLQQDPKTQQITITATVPGAPAEKAGFKSGDIIVAVNGTNVVGKNLDEVRTLIEGKLGTSVAITVKRPSTNQTLTISVIRSQFKVPGVIMHYIAEAQIADIQILGFDSGVSDQLKTALTQAKKLGAKSLILDLRDNPGGYLQEAINTASEFLSSGNVLLEQDSSGKRTPDPVTGSPVDTRIPMVVLVNENTASAAEIVSGALKDNNRAIIMGVKTLGTGTVLNEFDLPDGSAIFLGVMEWLTPKGNFIRDQGITPNIKVPLNQGASPLTTNEENQRNMTLQQILNSGDNQLAKAIQYLQGH